MELVGSKFPSPVGVFLLQSACGLAMAVDFGAGAWLVEPHAVYAGYTDLLQTYTLWAFLILAPPLGVANWLVIAPLDRVRRAIDAGVPPEKVDPHDARQALTLYLPLSRIALLSWFVPAVGWPVVVWIWGTPQMLELAFPLALSTVACAGVANRFIFAVFYVHCYYRIGPWLLKNGLEHLEPFEPVRSWHFVFSLMTITGVLQPVVVICLLLQGSVSPAILIYLAVSILMFSLLVSLATLLGVSRNLGDLATNLERVRNGNLQAEVELHNLDTFAMVGSNFNNMVEGLRQREFLRDTFRRYVSQQVAEEILAGKVDLGGELRTATVLFSDIRGFTRMSESMTPQEVVGFLNGYLNVMVEVVFNNGGVLDKFIGDAIMAVWGVPSGGGEAEDARAAVRCAREMSEGLDALNVERAARGLPEIDIGIGLHTGPLVAGNIGSERFMEYTVIGDTVNVSARLESLNKKLGTRILLSEQTAKLVEGEMHCEALEEHEVAGRELPIRVYHLAS